MIVNSKEIEFNEKIYVIYINKIMDGMFRGQYTGDVYGNNELLFEGDRIYCDCDLALHETELDFPYFASG